MSCSPLIDGIIALFRAIASRLSEALAGALEGFLADWGRAAEEGVRDPASAGAGAEVLGVVRVLVIALLAGALVAAFWYGLRRFRPRRGGAVEERESVFSRALLRAQLAGLFTRRGRRPPEPYLPLEGEGPRARIAGCTGRSWPTRRLGRATRLRPPMRLCPAPGADAARRGER